MADVAKGAAESIVKRSTDYGVRECEKRGKHVPTVSYREYLRLSSALTEDLLETF